jgi:hypothetical protein
MKPLQMKHDNTMAKSKTTHFQPSKMMMMMMSDENDDSSVSLSTSSLQGMPIQIQANRPLLENYCSQIDVHGNRLTVIRPCGQVDKRNGQIV